MDRSFESRSAGVRFRPLSTLHIRSLRFVGRHAANAMYRLVTALPMFHFVRAYEDKQGAITLRIWFFQKVVGFNRHVYWGVHPASKVVEHRNIIVGVDCNPGIEPGCYIQGIGRLTIGDHTKIAANVSIISANHSLTDISRHEVGEVSIGKFCWIGAGAIILPNTSLGDFTVVGAGAVVTKSFPEGYCVIAGNPARKIRDLDAAQVSEPTSENPYIGYMRKRDFERYKAKGLLL